MLLRGGVLQSFAFFGIRLFNAFEQSMDGERAILAFDPVGITLAVEMGGYWLEFTSRHDLKL